MATSRAVEMSLAFSTKFRFFKGVNSDENYF